MITQSILCDEDIVYLGSLYIYTFYLQVLRGYGLSLFIHYAFFPDIMHNTTTLRNVKFAVFRE